MQQLKIEHKKITSTSNQIVVENKTILEKKDRREGKGAVLAVSRRTYRLQYTDVYYVESETADNIYYFVKYEPCVFEWCSCPDNSTRHVKCKHLFGIEFAIRWGTLQDIEKLPEEAKRYGATISVSKSYEEDGYDF